ncbi:4'-phosphopantetheinyl transferase family protein [Roseateles chitinivorans]|uniref:4'-phosphopantetheinyl transferase family protein n=1 Tax=Roseateles chitinivorans TaxID=2917965 RepID=UPI003D67374F
MTPTLHIATVGDDAFVPAPVCDTAPTVREQLHRLAPARLREIDAQMTSAPHTLPAPVVGRGIDLTLLDRLTQDLTLDGLPAVIRRSSRARQLGYLGGRLCAETALLDLADRCEVLTAAMTAAMNAAIPIGDGGAPQWPEGVIGSIAHTRDGAWAAVAPGAACARLGIDSEVIVDEAGCRDIVAVCCTPRERRRWFELADPLRATLLFSAKESVYKAIHPQVKRFVDFDEVEMVGIEDLAGTLCLHFRATPEGPLAGRIPALQVHARVVGERVHTAIADLQDRGTT